MRDLQLLWLLTNSYRSPFQGSNEMEMKVALMLSVTGYVLKKIHNINGILHQKTWSRVGKDLKQFKAKNINKEDE